MDENIQKRLTLRTQDNPHLMKKLSLAYTGVNNEIAVKSDQGGQTMLVAHMKEQYTRITILG